MIRSLLIAVLALLALPVQAQVTRNCVSQTCTIISDPFPSTAVQPTQCRLYSGATALQTSPVAGPAGAVYCSFSRTFASGTYSLSATAIAADGSESVASNVITFTSSLGAPPAPLNLRFQ